FLEPRIARFNDPADAAPKQRRIQRLIRIEPRPHIRIDRHDQRLDPHLAIADRRNSGGNYGKVFRHRHASWPPNQMNLTAASHRMLPNTLSACDHETKSTPAQIDRSRGARD